MGETAWAWPPWYHSLQSISRIDAALPLQGVPRPGQPVHACSDGMLLLPLLGSPQRHSRHSNDLAANLVSESAGVSGRGQRGALVLLAMPGWLLTDLRYGGYLPLFPRQHPTGDGGSPPLLTLRAVMIRALAQQRGVDWMLQTHTDLEASASYPAPRAPGGAPADKLNSLIARVPFFFFFFLK